MPKKKGKKKNIPQDFTINDCANASKPVTRIKKATTSEASTIELSWDQIEDNDVDIVEEVNSDGTKSFVYKKKRNHLKSDVDIIDGRPGILYPEIVWYLIAPFIKPENIGNFAGINKAAYAVTKRESFWRSLYRKYCQNNPKLPRRLCLENGFKSYGLRQRVIRSLYCTYNVFIKKVQQQALHDSKPHQLVKRRCVNVWFCKGAVHWLIFFKLKKLQLERISDIGSDFLEELGRIDANPEEDTQVLQACYGDVPAATQGTYCGEIPNNILPCLHTPKIFKPVVGCEGLKTECEKMTCLFRESGWFDGDKVNKLKVTQHLTNFAKDYPDWSPAVQHAKTACLSIDLPAQGVYTNCPAYDIVHCSLISFIRNAKASQWSTAKECEYTRSFAGACPVCPSDCFASAVPYGSCNACLSLPRSP